MKRFRWSHSKNERLKCERQISFEEIVLAIEDREFYFLKTVIPSRKATRDYLHHGDPDAQA